MEKIYLLSYPRSGNTFTRYILESFTGYASRGYKTRIDSSNVINKKSTRSTGKIIKRHGHLQSDIEEFENVKKEDKLIFLIRNPLEAFIRHEPNKINNFIKDQQIKDYEFFFNNLKIYNSFQGKKILLKYESLIANPREYCENIHSFIDCPIITVEEFMKDYDKHFENSKRFYRESKSGGNKKVFHSEFLTQEEKNKFWDFFNKNCIPTMLNLFEEYQEKI